MLTITLKDKRIATSRGKRYPVDTFKNYQKKTVVEYDYLTRKYKVYTNVLTHISRILAIKEADINILTVNEVGNITSLEATLEDKNILFRSIKKNRELTELDKQNAKERLLKGRKLS